jgi:hypothetical protein
LTAAIVKLPGTSPVPAGTPKTARASMETLIITPAAVSRWLPPPFQRPKKTNKRTVAVTEAIKKEGGIIPGTITLGKFNGNTYLVDGQHRIGCFLDSELPEGLADVRVLTFNTLAEMAEEFSQLNSHIVPFRKDDILRGMEAYTPALAELRRRCPFVGYDNVRQKSKNSKVLSMSTAIRTWLGSEKEPNDGPSTSRAVELLSDEEVSKLAACLATCWEAWGREPESFRLWGKLNLGIVFWLWRRIVLKEDMPAADLGGRRRTIITPDQFRLCLMALSANGRYVEWLLGRNLKERDRKPCYDHVKSIFVGRLGGMGLGRPLMPSPEWAK